MDEILESESSENNEDNMKKNTFKIISVQCGALKILFEGLSKIINNCTLYVNSEGIKIYEKVDDKCILFVKLLSEKFEYYECSNELAFKIDLKIFKLICKNIKNSHTVTLCKSEEDNDKISIILHEQPIREKYDMNIEMIDEYYPNICPIDYNMEILILSDYFKNIITNFKKSLCDNVNFIYINKKLLIKCEGKNYNNEIIIDICDNENDETQKNIEVLSDIEEDKIYNKCVQLKYLIYCTYFRNLQQYCKIYFDNNKPFIYEGNIASIGKYNILINE